jgi:hypothetical protein
MKQIILALAVITASVLYAQEKPTAVEIMNRVDDNEVWDTISYTGEMIIEYKGKRYEKTFEAYGRENQDSFIEFTNSEDKGTKYLKKDGRLYVYSPDTEQVMLISGHMLKESMMGSDMSYEDTIENATLNERYNGEITGSETKREREVWVLELTAKKKIESYQKRKLWVAKDNYDLVHAEYYALSGAKLKEFTLLESKKIGNRYFPIRTEMKDLLRKESKTTFIMNEVKLDAQVKDSVFSLRNLER